MFFDPVYLAILGLGMLLSLAASGYVKSKFARGSAVPISSGLRGADVAAAILRDADISNVSIVEHPGFMSDHYNPMTRTLALSPDVYHGQNAAAAGVAAHEVGHAIQHAHGYAPMWLRSFLVPVANIGSMLGPVLVMIGAALGAAQAAGPSLGQGLAITGVVIFGAATLFTLITVPVEFDASSRAKRCLAHLGIVRPGEEEAAVRGVLLAAGLTYVAAAITAVLQLLYWALRAGLLGGRRDD